VILDTVWHEDSEARETSDEFLKCFDALKEQQSLRVQFDRFWCSLYYDRAYQGFCDGRDWGDIFTELLEPNSGRLNENVILRIVATLAARFAKQKSKPQCLTTLGDWALQRRADRYSRLFEGAMHEMKVYELQRQSDLTDIICGTGAIYCTSRKSRLIGQAVPCWELYTEIADSRRMNPSRIYWRRILGRRRLMKLYPEHTKEIEGAQSVETREAFDAFGAYDVDVVEVVTGWSLPTDEDSDDGRVMTAIRGVVLDDAEWNRPRLPFAFSRYMLPPDGMWGIGVVSGLVGAQAELNRSLANRQTALEMCSAPFIAVERGSQIVDSHMSDQIGRIVEYTGTMPSVVAPGTLHPEQMQHTDRVRGSMFSASGLSELAATSLKPAGLESGKALRVYADMMDDAFHDAMLRRDQQILDLAEIILDEIESIAEDTGNYKTKYVGSFGVEKIEYSDICIDRDSMYLKVLSTSSLSSTIAGRLEDVVSMQEAGVELSPDEREHLLNIPDLSESSERRNSMPNLLRQLIEEEMLGEGKWTTPEPRWDLQRALDIVSQTILMAQLRKAPTDRIDMLRKFEVECMRLVASAQPPSEPPAAAMPPAVGPDMGPEQAPVPVEGQSPIVGGEQLTGPDMGQGMTQ
jgi:hypothetical protein